MSSSWLAVLIPLFMLSLFLVITVALSLTRIVRGSVVAEAPMEEQVTLSLPLPGPYQLFVEGKRFSTDFRGLDFAMTDRSGEAVPMYSALMRTTVSGFSRVRLQLRSFHLRLAGPVTIRVHNLKRGRDPENRIVIGRPFGGALVIHVLALVALGALTIASLGGSIALIVMRANLPPR